MSSKQANYQIALAPMKSTEELRNMPKKDLRSLFIKLTDHLRIKGVGYFEQARLVERKGSSLNESRMRNIRKQVEPTIYPHVQEVADLMHLFSDKLADFREDGPEPTETEKRLTAIENEIAELKKKEEIRQQILSEIVKEIKSKK